MSAVERHTGTLRKTVAITLAVALALMLVPATAGAVPKAACDNRNNNTIRKLLECVTIEGVREHQAAFQDIADANGGTRSSGTSGYDASVDYAAGILTDAGYEVTIQEFDFTFEIDDSTLAQTAPESAKYPVFAAQFDESQNGSADGRLVPADVVIPPGAPNSSTSGCEAQDFIDAGFQAGDVALVQRGTCAFGLKATNAQAAGASAVVIMNEGQPGRTGFIIPIGPAPGLTIPVVATDFANGEALYNAAQAGEVQVTVTADFTSEIRQAENILAETRHGNDDNVVMVGAHLDSVLEGPGINDNGSGSAAILDVAEAMRKFRPNNTVRFALWGSEEFGLLGSEFYVDSLTPEEQEDVALYLNFDMIGSPNYVRFVYDGDGSGFGIPGPAGSASIEDLFTQFYSDKGLQSEETPFDGRSDYGPFIAVGIPAGGLFTGAEGMKTPEQVAIYGGVADEQYDQCYHQACDTFDNVALDVLDLNADSVSFATMTYAKSPGSLDTAAAAALSTLSATQQFTVRGNKAEG